MDQNLKDQFLDNLTKAENILIVVAKSLGFDGLAAGLSLYLSLIKLDKNVAISAQAPTVGDAQSLYAVDKIGSGKGTQNPVIIVENAVETVDKVTHFLDKSQLKLVIHPLPGSSGITKDQISIEYTQAPANLIFAIGVDNLPDLRSEITHEQEITPEALIINISNMEPSQKFAQMDIVNTQASGVSEVTSQMIHDFALPVDEDIAFNLYSGIRQSTNNFSPNLTIPQSFEIASWLLKFGAGKASLAKMQKPQPNMPPRPTFTFSPQQIQQAQQEDVDQFEDEDYFERVPAQEEVELEPQGAEAPKSGDWLKPPKVYKGSKSIGGESKG